MEYSNEFLARVYGAYMGCEYAYFDTDAEKWVCEQSSITPYSLMGIAQDGDYGRIKTCLTPLPAITDEHAIEVAKIINVGDPKHYSDKVLIFQGANHASLYQAGVSPTFKYRTSGRIEQKVIDYLRSKGYDCGYAEIPSLIDAGLAIDKTTLNN